MNLLVNILDVSLETFGHGGMLHDLCDVVVRNWFPAVYPGWENKIVENMIVQPSPSRCLSIL